LATATLGSILKSSTRAGVMSAPPPIPVSPTVNPPAKPASMSSGTRALPATPRPAAGVDGDAVLFQHERRQLLRRHQGVRRPHPLLDLVPAGGVGLEEGQCDPAVSPEPVARRLDVRVGRDDRRRLLLRQLETQVLRRLVAEDEVLPAHPKR